MVSVGKWASLVGMLAVAVFVTRSYMGGGVCRSTARIDGKVVIITGANSGIGKETAIDLIRRGARVYVVCRSSSRGQKALKDIKERSGAEDSQIHLMQMDLTSLKSVRQFAEDFKKREKRLDILINNAGVMLVPQSKTEDGFELTFGVNHLGPFLLTHMLLDLMKASAPSRIINVASLAHAYGSINFDDIMGEKDYGRSTSYSQSKLANIMHAKELAKRLKGTGITTYSLHPGAVRTELFRNVGIVNLPVIKQIRHIVLWPFVKNAWEGAQTTICCAVAEELTKESGKYYSDCKETEPYSQALDEEVSERLWDLSMELVGLTK